MEPQAPKLIRHNSPYCYYIAGIVFLLYALLLPFYRLSDYLLAGGLAAGAFAVSSIFLPKQVTAVKQEPVSSGNEAVDKALSEGHDYLNQLAGIRRRIIGDKVKTSLVSIEGTVNLILKDIVSDPSDAPQVRRLMSYYLPTLIKLSDFYQRLEEQGGSGENVETSKARIEENLTVLDSALKKQLDLLYENDALDISSDITVMEQMLSQEGLKGGLNDTLK